jgi:Dolichyl-phosphate-mannose-protein mannosyltransferase
MNWSARLLPDIGVITILALIVRVICATWTGLTADEVNGVLIAVNGSWLDMLRHLALDGNTPVFYSILRVYCLLFGHGGFAIRCLAIVLGTLAVPAIYWLFRRVLPRDICIALALLLALCPTSVCYGDMIRPYAIEGVLGVLSTLACVSTLSSSTNIWRSILYAVTTALLVYNHYWGAFVPIGHVGLVLVGLYFGWFGKRQFVFWFGGAALALFLFVPQLLAIHDFLFGVSAGFSPFDLATRPFQLACDLLPSLILSKGYGGEFWDMFILIVCDFLLFVAFVAPGPVLISATDRRQPAQITYDGRMWKAATICGLLAAFCVGLYMPSLRYRYLTPFVPMLFIVYVTGVNALFSNKSAWIRLVIPCLVWISLFARYLIFLPAYPESTAEAILTQIVEKSDHRKDAVIIGWELIAPVINYYLPAEIESVSYPHLGRLSTFQWSDMFVKMQKPDILPRLFEKMQGVLDRGGKIWFVDAAHSILPLDYRNNDLALGCPFMEVAIRRSDQIRSWLVTHSRQVGATSVAPGSDFSIMVTVFAPVGKDPASQAALPSPDMLINSVIPDEFGADQTAPAKSGDSATNSDAQPK